MQETTFRERASERMWKCEGLFAEAKQNRCLARAKYRGWPKVQIQAYLCAIVQNLKRLLLPFYCWLLARETRQRSTCSETVGHSQEPIRVATGWSRAMVYAQARRKPRIGSTQA
jgi:hypothetical protein